MPLEHAAPGRSAWRVRFRPLRAASARRVLRPQERAAARRALAISALVGLLRGGAALAVSAGLSLGAWHVATWARSAPAFAVQAVRVHGASHAAEADLLARSGLVLGDNIFAVDTAIAQRRLEEHPWVKRARVVRSLPATLELTVVEHEAQALVQMGDLYLADSAGRIFKHARAADGMDLPLVTGLSRASWTADPEAGRARLLEALGLVLAWQGQLPLAELSEVRVDPDGGLSAFARQDDFTQELHLGRGDFAGKLKRMALVRAALARRGERAKKLELQPGGAEATPERGEWVAAQLDTQAHERNR